MGVRDTGSSLLISTVLGVVWWSPPSHGHMNSAGLPLPTITAVLPLLYRVSYQGSWKGQTAFSRIFHNFKARDRNEDIKQLLKHCRYHEIAGLVKDMQTVYKLLPFSSLDLGEAVRSFASIPNTEYIQESRMCQF
jgi:hypothetical protein